MWSDYAFTLTHSPHLLTSNQIYVMIDGQLASLTWSQAPIWSPRTDFLLLSDSCGFVDVGCPLWWGDGVYRLQLLLVLASAVILVSESRGTHDRNLLSQIRDSPNLVGQVPVFISPRNRVAQYTPRYWVPFSSPPTTRRAMVEVFQTAWTRAGCCLAMAQILLKRERVSVAVEICLLAVA
jgi:hypothetical protein